MKIRKITFWILAILPVLGLAFWKGQEFLRLELPQQMDVLAGVSTVYALVFLILGYRQQGKELAQNTEALTMQTEELKNSVLQAEELVKVTRDQLELDQKTRKEEAERLERINQPFFVIHTEKSTGLKSQIHGHPTGKRFPIANTGTRTLNVKFDAGKHHANPSFLSVFESGAEIQLDLLYATSQSEDDLTLTITYRTLVGTEGVRYFRFHRDSIGSIQVREYDTPPLIDS